MEKLFYKYKQVNDNTRDSIKNHYFYFSKPSQLNDTFDIIIPGDYSTKKEDIIAWAKRCNLDQSLLKSILEKPTIMEQADFISKMEEGIEQLRKSFFILCLSEVWDESQMWAYYADSKKGICLGYESIFTNKSYLLALDKKNDPNPFFIETANAYYVVLVKVDYSKTDIIPYNPMKRNIEAIKNGFYFKEQKWNSEKEYRSVLTSLGNSKIEFSQKIYYADNILREVIFGLDTSLEDKKNIYRIIKDNYAEQEINFYQIIPNTKSLIISRKLLNDDDFDRIL